MKKLAKRILIACVSAIVAVGAIFGLTACNNNAKDWEYIQEKGTLIVGYTEYDPFGYTDTDNVLKGFDVELAKEVGEKLGLTVEFQIIKWANKVTDLNSKIIDVVWNAMTISDELKEVMSITAPYCKNTPVAIALEANAANFNTKDKILASAGAIAVEGGSSAESAIKEDSVLGAASILSCDNQLKAIQEVKSGSSKVAVVDGIMFDQYKVKGASNVEGIVKLTDVKFVEEYFGIGVRKGSPLLEKIENALAELKTEGKYQQIAAKYGLSDLLIEA